MCVYEHIWELIGIYHVGCAVLHIIYLCIYTHIYMQYCRVCLTAILRPSNISGHIRRGTALERCTHGHFIVVPH